MLEELMKNKDTSTLGLNKANRYEYQPASGANKGDIRIIREYLTRENHTEPTYADMIDLVTDMSSIEIKGILATDNLNNKRAARLRAQRQGFLERVGFE